MDHISPNPTAPGGPTRPATGEIPTQGAATDSMMDIELPPVKELPPPQPPPLSAQRITIPPNYIRPLPISPPTPLLSYHLPMDKARPPPMETDAYFIPPGSSADPSILIRPASPTTPFEFPFQVAEETYCDFNVMDGTQQKCLMDSVTHVVGLPRVCGLSMVDDLMVRVTRSIKGNDVLANPSLMDGGANICLTGVLGLLVDVESIAPLPISVATKNGDISLDDCCTKRGLLPLTLADSSVYYQPCYYCKNAVETIISPQAILNSSDILVRWTQTGHKDGSPGMIRFDSDSGLFSMEIALENRDGLYYCPTDVFTVDADPIRCDAPTNHRAHLQRPTPVKRRHMDLTPVPPNRLTESELWMLRLGSPGEEQLDLLPGNVTGIPPRFQYHPFRFIDWKEEARVQKQAAGKMLERTTDVGRRFYADFGFMWASSTDYSRPNKINDRVVNSWDGYSSYLLIVDEASRYIWVFLTKSKEPPLDILDSFLTRFGHINGGSI